MLDRSEAIEKGLRRDPQFRRGSRIVLVPEPQQWRPARSLARSLSLLSLGSWREQGEEAVAPQEPYVNPGIGWVGGEGEEKKGK